MNSDQMNILEALRREQAELLNAAALRRDPRQPTGEIIAEIMSRTPGGSW